MTRILLVEDNEMNRDMLSRRLARKGYEVALAVDGRQGVEMAQTMDYDLVLMDMSLPEVDGWDLTRMLKADPSFADVPIVAVSGCVLPSERARAEEAGCAVFLPKPCDPGLILAEVKRLLGDP